MLWREGQPDLINSGDLKKNAYGYIFDGTYKVLKEDQINDDFDEMAANSHALMKKEDKSNKQ